MRKRLSFFVALAAALVSCAVSAVTPLTALRLTPDTAITLGVGDTLATTGEVVRHDLSSNAVTALVINGLPAGVDVVGYHYRLGAHYVVFATTVTLGGITFTPRDVALTDGGGTWSKYFDGVAAGIPDGVAIDALAIGTDAYLRFSFDTAVNLGGTFYDPRDVARFAVGAFSMSNALSSQIPAGINLVGLDVLPNGHWLVALDGSGSMAGVNFDDEDVLEYSAPDTWERVYDGSAQDADWSAAGIAALAGEMAPGVRVMPEAGLTTSESGAAASFSVSLLTPPESDVVIALSSSDTTEGLVSPSSLTFTSLNWAASQTVTVTGVDDGLVDGDIAYTIGLTLTSSDPAYNGLVVDAVSVTNQDDEAAPSGSLQFAAPSQTVSEAVGMVTVTVSRIGGSAGAVSVTYQTHAGTASSPADFGASSETLYWADGDVADKSFTVAIVDDALVEGDETFAVSLTDPEGGATLGTPVNQTITLLDNDALATPGRLRFAVDSQTVSENAGTLVVTVSRVDGSDGAVSVDYATTPGSATAPADFALASGTLSWADGDSADKTFTVTVHDDAIAEGPENFVLALSAPSGGAVLGVPANQTVTLNDDDVVVVTTVPGLATPGLTLMLALLAGLAWRELARRSS